MSGPMNSIGLFSFFPHKSELKSAIGVINHTVLGSGLGAQNRHFAQISMERIAVLSSDLWGKNEKSPMEFIGPDIANGGVLLGRKTIL